MFALKRALVLLTAVMVMLLAVPALADSGLRILVSDAEGHEAVMTSFTEDGTAAWWAQIPEECGFSGLKLQISGSDRYEALDGTAFDAPDAGADLLNAAYVPVTVRDTDGADQAAVRLYVSRSPYTPRPDRSYRNVRAMGRWGRINGSNTKLLDDPGAAGRSIGTLDSGTRGLVLYTCRARGVEYACIQVGDEACYVRSNSIRMLSDATNLAFDMPMLSERRKTEQVKLARTAYKTGLREVLGGSSDAVVETAPVDTPVLVLANVTFRRVRYDLIYRLDNGRVGFVHASQLRETEHAESSEMLAGGKKAAQEPYQAAAAKETALREFPKSDAVVMSMLSPGAGLTVYATVDAPGGRFCLAAAGDRLGYVREVDLYETAGTAEHEAVSVSAVLEDAMGSAAYTITAHEAILYAAPGFDAAAVARLTRGEWVTCTEKQGAWLRVTAENEVSGWLPEAFARQLRLGYMSEEGFVD